MIFSVPFKPKLSRSWSPVIIIWTILLLLLTNTRISAQEQSIMVSGQERFFEVHLPTDFSENSPLLLALTGFTCDIRIMRELSQFHEFADTMGIVVVYPDAPYPGWNTGATIEGYTFDTTRDDVKFISDLIDTMHAAYQIDLDRVFSTGWSGGGVMTFRLMGEIGHRLAAVASAGGGLHKESYKYMDLEKTFPIMLFYGTDDFTCHWTDNTGYPYNGLPIEESINVLRKANGYSADPLVVDIPDIVKEDSSTVQKITFSGPGSSKFIVYKIINGGHTWPGQAMPVEPYHERLNKDINASIEILKFFQQYMQ